MQTNYFTIDVAYLLDISIKNIYYYIKTGLLIATKVDGKYIISHQNFISFKNQYFFTENRNNNRGSIKDISNNDILEITLVFFDVQNNNISLKQFVKKWGNSKFKIVLFNQLKKLKRNNCIVFERYQYNYTYKYLAKKYNISFELVKKIIKNKKGDIYVKDVFNITLL
jgi:hypothetical protein